MDNEGLGHSYTSEIQGGAACARFEVTEMNVPHQGNPNDHGQMGQDRQRSCHRCIFDRGWG